MLSLLRQVLPAKARHAIIGSLAKPVRHKIIDYYIAHQHEQYEKFGKINSDGKEANFWANIPDEHIDNAPEVYAANTEYNWATDLLKGIIDRRVGNKGSILEFGCNAGRVLHAFADDGYKCVAVDINQSALDLAIKTFPSLKKAELICGDGTNVLKNIPSNYVDAVYTCAVLRHVSPHSIEPITKELSRIAGKFIVTFEDEGSFGKFTFPRNYNKIFERLGWKQTALEYAIDYRVGEGLLSIGNVIRVFERNQTAN